MRIPAWVAVIAASLASPFSTACRLNSAVPASNRVMPQSRLKPNASRVPIERWRS
ncbi:hypothetical protein D3C80_1817750 [compost metagenome]